MRLLTRIRRALSRRGDFQARTGNLDAVINAAYDVKRTRISIADMDRPEGMGRKTTWPPPIPRSIQNQELDYDE